MLFTSIEFVLLFFPLAFGLYYLLNERIRNYYLLAVSLVFYAWGDLASMGILIASILFNYALPLAMQKILCLNNKSSYSLTENDHPRIGLCRLILVIDILLNAGLLITYKYLDFFTEILNTLVPFLKIQSRGMGTILPMGISFFTFKGISYAVDVYQKKIPAQNNPVYFGLYLAFFPQMIAGPIARYSTMAERMVDRPIRLASFSRGLMQFVVGFNKKVLLADILVKVADSAFGASTNSVCMAWLGALCYTLQIYFDFSGYSDMAIGLGAMLGFYTPHNFDYPYTSQTITEFWRRWHISLGAWFRDYVYFPLGGSRVKGKARLVLNLFVVWTLTGIWHGANWTFIVWGLMYGVIISIEKLASIPQRLTSANQWTQLLYRIFTLLMVVIGWVFFRSKSLESAFQYLRTMFGFSGQVFADDAFVFNLLDNKIYIAFGILFCMPVSRWAGRFLKRIRAPFGYAAICVVDVVQVILFAVSLSCLVLSTHNPFVYMNF